MARWPSPSLIQNLLREWHNARSQLIIDITSRNWHPWMILTPSINKYYRPRRKPTEIAHLPERHLSSFRPSRTLRSLPNPSHSPSTPPSPYDRFQRFVSLHQKTTSCHGIRSCISPSQRRSGKPCFVPHRDGFDGTKLIVFLSHCSRGAMTRSVPGVDTLFHILSSLGRVAPFHLLVTLRLFVRLSNPSFRSFPSSFFCLILIFSHL